MGKVEEIRKLINEKDNPFLEEFSNKIYENLKDLNAREEKHNLWAIIIIFLYIILKSTTIKSVDIGPITLEDLTVISKVLPLVFIYILFNLRTIALHKKDTVFTMKILSEKMFNQKIPSDIYKDISNSFIIRMYLPYSFSNYISKISSKKPHIIESLIGAPIIFISVIIAGLAPYLVIFLMLYDIYKNYMNDILGITSFYISILAFIVMIFFSIIMTFRTESENN